MRGQLMLALALIVTGCSTNKTPERASAHVLADLVVVDKSDGTLTLFAKGKIIRAYAGLQFGDQPVGHKQFEGDERTPEGRYTIDYGNPHSAYHLSLHISYPNAADTQFAKAQGRSPGGLVFLHGQPNALPFGRAPGNWTDGCIALSNAEIEQLWMTIPDRTPIQINA